MIIIAKWLVFLGLALILAGGLLWLCQKAGLPIGKFPGDIIIKREKWALYAPIMTSIIISVVLTVLINFILWWMRR